MLRNRIQIATETLICIKAMTSGDVNEALRLVELRNESELMGDFILAIAINDSIAVLHKLVEYASQGEKSDAQKREHGH